MDFLTLLLTGMKETVIRKGRWWGPVEVEEGRYEQRKIDVVIETERALYIGECKWSDIRMGEGDLQHLKHSAAALKARKPVRWVLFSKAGFSGLEEGEDLLLFDARRIIDAKAVPGRSGRPQLLWSGRGVISLILGSVNRKLRWLTYQTTASRSNIKSAAMASPFARPLSYLKCDKAILFFHRNMPPSVSESRKRWASAASVPAMALRSRRST
ncbi:MAG: hypothetical protein JRN37_08790 [Nitrososphaerota archaeon]|jgi:hypothetical protein|nr:hypothetical protein [Nitrososphaerota archaeon]MDG7043218.1 hypothetical protein [Nitrososphaerota archaeon]